MACISENCICLSSLIRYFVVFVSAHGYKKFDLSPISWTNEFIKPQKTGFATLLQNKLCVFCYPFYLTFTRSCCRTHKGSWRPYNILCQQPEYALPKVWQVEIHATSGVGTDLFLNSISTHEESCLCNSFPSFDRYSAGFTCSIACHLLPTPDLSLPTRRY